MKIVRDGKEIELTPQEIQRAYDMYLTECKLLDAESQYKEWLEYEDINVEKAHDVEWFIDMYGFEPAAAMDRTSGHYLLEVFVKTFDDKFDTSRAENDIWHNAISDTMDEIAKAYRASHPDKTFELTYTETLVYKFTVQAKDARAAERIWRGKNAAGEAAYQCDNPAVVIASCVTNVEEVK